MRVAAIVFVSVLVASTGATQTTPVEPMAPLSALIAEARAHSPAIRAALSEATAVRQRQAWEKTLPAPVVSASYNSSGYPWPGAGLGAEPTANLGVMVMQELPGRGKRDLRFAVAAREATASDFGVEAATLAVVARVKELYFRYATTHAAIDVFTRNRALLELLLRVGETRYGVGSAAQQDVLKAQVELGLLDLRLERLRQEHAGHEAEFNILLGRAPASPLGTPPAFGLEPFEASVEALVFDAQTSAPVLKRDETLIARAEAAIEVAKRDTQPDFAVSAGYYYMGAMPSMYMARLDVKLPPRRARLAAEIGEQASRLAAARHAYDTELQSIAMGVNENQRAARTSWRLGRLYQDAVLPQVRLVLESSIVSYQTGAVDFLSVLTNFGGVLENELRYLDEVEAYHLAVSRLEALTGTTLLH